MGKRGHENAQVKKEDLEAEESKGSNEPVGPFQRASAETLKRRKIVGSKWGTPSSSGSSRSQLAEAKLKVQQQQAASKTSPINPFAGVKLPSTGTAALPPFSFGAVATSTSPAPLLTTTAAATTTTFDLSPELKAEQDKAYQLYFEQLESLDKNPSADDLSNIIEAYQNKIADIYNRDTNRSASSATVTTTTTTNPASTAAVTQTFSPPTTAPKTAGGFSFGSSASATTTTPSPTATNNVTSPSTGFSFGTAPSSANNNFAFRAGSTPGPSKISSPPNSSTPAPARAPDSEWDVIYQFRTKYYKFDREKQDFEGFAAGPLKLERNKTTGKARMVMWDPAGKVQLNLAIFGGMKFDSRVHPKKKDRYWISFVAQGEQKQFERYMLLVVADCVEEAVAQLTKLAAE
jgi:hypothetical protein